MLRITSPFGVAPPVSDDWAPIGRTAGTERTSAATSASDEGVAIPAANPPGKCAASSRNDASTSGSRPIGGGEPAASQGNRERIALAGMGLPPGSGVRHRDPALVSGTGIRHSVPHGQNATTKTRRSTKNTKKKILYKKLIIPSRVTASARAAIRRTAVWSARACADARRLP